MPALRAAAIPDAVGLYITAAYWFTASTSFANPAVTIARSLSDTFAGIAPAGVPAFIVAQLVGRRDCDGAGGVAVAEAGDGQGVTIHIPLGRYSPRMDRAEQLRDDLTFTDRMIAASQLHITRLKKIISEMARDAQDTDLARDVLASYAAALTRHEAQRRVIVSMMDASPVEEQKPATVVKMPPGKPRNRHPPRPGCQGAQRAADNSRQLISG